MVPTLGKHDFQCAVVPFCQRKKEGSRSMEIERNEGTTNSNSSSTMNAVVVRAFGDDDHVFEMKQVAVPDLSEEDEVLIEVYSSSINPVDWKASKGHLGIFGPKVPYTAGSDFAGIIVKIGSSVRNFKVGDRVWGCKAPKFAAWAEFLVEKESLISLAPYNIPLHLAGCLPLVGLTAIQSLKSVAESDRVLILGGSGGTGSIGIQIAKALGAYVSATSSGKNLSYLKSTGADECIDYTLPGSWVDPLKGQDYDLIYDTVGEKVSYDKSYPVLKPGGRFVTITVPDGDLSVGSVAKLGGSFVAKKFWEVMGYNKFEFVLMAVNKKDLATLKDMVESKRVGEGIPGKEFKFEQDDVNAMVMESKEGRARGKLVLVMKREQHQQQQQQQQGDIEQQQQQEGKEENKNKEEEQQEEEK